MGCDFAVRDMSAHAEVFEPASNPEAAGPWGVRRSARLFPMIGACQNDGAQP